LKGILGMPFFVDTIKYMKALKKYKIYLIGFLFLGFPTALNAFKPTQNEDRFLYFIVNPKKQSIALFYKDDKQKRFGSIQNLKTFIEQKHLKLEFAMNGGMYKKDGSPQGLYIESGKIISTIDTITNAHGNFYLQPNGIFYITDANKAGISTTKNFKNSNVKYATQSGPMLLTDGRINDAFKEGSANLQIRNGVGMLPNGNAVFAISKEPVNFYDFALNFKNLGCKNALYLDGYVSRAYIPTQKLLQTDGDFGVIIAVKA